MKLWLGVENEGLGLSSFKVHLFRASGYRVSGVDKLVGI